MQGENEKAKEVVRQVNKVILGKEKETKEVMLSFLAGGHILLEDIPGVGKTTMALAFSKAMNLEYKRVQFTPDVMPSDLTGFSIYQREQEKFVYKEGVVFCNLLLADEINRTSPKTQSALLEVMEERKVTVEGVTRRVPSPFLVIATQNPYGSHGTQFLPEAQMDRFMISMTIGYPDYESELQMAMTVDGTDRLGLVDETRLSREELLSMQRDIHQVFIKESVYRYILDLIQETRNNPYIERGASPRGTIAMIKMAKAKAWYEGRDYVTPSDVAEQFPYVISHRILTGAAARLEQMTKAQILEEIAKKVKKPPMGASKG